MPISDVAVKLAHLVLWHRREQAHFDKYGESYDPANPAVPFEEPRPEDPIGAYDEGEIVVLLAEAVVIVERETLVEVVPELSKEMLVDLVEGFQQPLVDWMNAGLAEDTVEEQKFVDAFALYVGATIEHEPDPYGCVAAACAGLLKGLVKGAKQRMMAAGGRPSSGTGTA